MWGHLKDKLEIKSISRVGGWVGRWVGGLSNVISDPTLALIRAQLGFRIQVQAECGKITITNRVLLDFTSGELALTDPLWVLNLDQLQPR